MKILCVSDFHSRDELIDAAIKEANSGEYDLFLSGGDFVKEEDYEKLLNNVEIPMFAAVGNWDFDFTPPKNEEFENLFRYMKVEFGEYRIVVIGSVFPEDYKKDVQEWLSGEDGRKTIFLSHYPPDRLGDATRSGNRAGMPGFRKLILKEKPAAWFTGHIHEDFGHFHLMDTEVFNCSAVETGKGFAVELGEDGVKDYEEVELV
ncbi:MAG: metallophosphoesterase [Candidatus Nanohaloarchaeota archaeon QJJ-9]|nr:metallophosphoesterase [Candidatus Nanohaloarchaeota archaeon QJJ-9]